MTATLTVAQNRTAGDTAPEVSGNAPPATLVMIASAGHSGSTLLDLLLGNHPRVSGAGEMNRLTLYASDRMCACGATVTNCSYWNQVRAAITKRRNRDGLIRWDECHTDIPPQRPIVTLDMRPEWRLTSGDSIPASMRRELTEAGLSIGDRAVASRAGVRDFKWRLTDPDNQQTWVLRPSEGRLDVYGDLLAWKNPVRVLPQPLEVALALGVQPALRAVRACSSAASAFVHIGENSWTVADAMAAVSGRPFVVDSSKSPLRLANASR